MSDEIVPLSTEEPFLRVSAGSSPQSLAAAIAHGLYNNRKVLMRAVGAGAVNQAVKAMAIARGYVAPRGLDLVVKPGFTTIDSRDGGITAIVFTVSAS
jgi:stage V sporulation protein S